MSTPISSTPISRLWGIVGVLCLLQSGCGGSAPPPPAANPYSNEVSAVPATVTPPSAPAVVTPPSMPPLPLPPVNPVVVNSTTSPQVPPRRGPPSQTQPAPTVPAPSPVTPAPLPVPVPQSPPAEEAMPATVAMNWKVTADPAVAGIDVARTHKLNLVKLPQLGAVGPEFVEAGRFRVLYSVTPGTAVALGLNDEIRHYREVWDFVAKRKLGAIRNLELGGAKAQTLSPDGRFFAYKPQWESAVQILEIATGKKSVAPKLSGTAAKLLAFAGPLRLIYEDKGELHVLAVPGFTNQATIKPANWSPEAAWTFSPGGKYMVITRLIKGGCEAEFLDLQLGESAGVLPLVAAGTCRAVAISRDGQQLAAWIEGTTPQLKTWSIADGASSGQYGLADCAEQISAHESYQGLRLEWFPNGRHLLFGGHAVFDTVESTIVTAIGGDEKPLTAQRVIGPQQILTVDAGQLAVLDLSASMKSSPAGIAGAKPGTPPTSAPPQPTETVANRSGITLAYPEEVAWSAQLAKPPAPSRITSRGINLPVGNIYMGRLSQTMGMVMYTSSPLVLGENGLPTFEANSRFWLQPVDLKTGAILKPVPLPEARLIMSLSPSGGMVCVHNANGLDRVEILSMKEGNREAGFAPYHDAAPGPDQRVTFAEFTDPSHLLTTGAGRLTHWDFMNARAEFEYEIGEMRPELSPARDYVAVADPGNRTVSLISLASGKPEGTVVVCELAGESVASCAFHPQGRWFATISQRGDGGELRVIDLVDGTEQKRLALPISAQVMQWVGDDYLLLNGSILVSVTRACVVWNYGLPQGMHIIDSPDQRHWYIAADPDRTNAVVLRGVDLPDGTVLERVGAAGLKGRLLLEPGQPVSLDVQVADVSGETGFAQKVTSFLTDRFSAARITVQPKSVVTLTVRDAGGGWLVALVSEGKTLWQQSIDGRDGPAALLDYEPPKHAFPLGTAQGAGQSNLNVQGTE